ncbi:MAG: hypothetical protein WCM76_09880 [Bacteroidota bacterium]
MKKTLTLIFFALLTQALYSQSPGYNGKKFSINYGFYFINATSNPNTNGNNGFFCFTTTHCLAPEYVVGRHIAMGLSLRYSRTGFFYKSNLIYNNNLAYNPYGSSYTLFGSNNKTDHRLTGTMNVISAGIYPKIFLKAGIAPLGSYMKPELIISMTYVQAASDAKMNDYINADHYYNVPDYPSPKISNYSPYMTIGAGLEFGETRILFNRLVLDYGLRMGLTFGSFMNQQAQVTESNYYELVSGRRLFQASLLNLKVGVGLLAF